MGGSEWRTAWYREISGRSIRKTAYLRVLAIAIAVAVSLGARGFAPVQANDSHTALIDVIVTAAPVYVPLAALRGEERFPSGAQLLMLHAGKAEPLVAGFAATADADVSFDGKTVLFAGKQATTAPWHIWELTLVDHSLRRLTSSLNDSIRPLYLPAGSIVYAQRTSHGFELETSQIAGSLGLPVESDANVIPISHIGASAVPADVLADGRILFEAGFPLGAGTTPELFLVYSDGSGVESVRCDHGAPRWGGRQLTSGDIVFTHGANLARFTSAVAHEASIAAPQAEYAGAIAETASGDWLMSARAGASSRYMLKLWKPGSAALQTVIAMRGEDILEPVLVAPRIRPHQHPSGLHDWNYANLMALDVRESREGDLQKSPARVRLETLDAQGRVVVEGFAPVEADGSFFVKVPADRPVRFTLLADTGSVMRREEGWFWIRRGEQRICVGCHAGPERASENRVPAVLLRTTTPVDLTGTNDAAKGTSGAKGNLGK